MPSGFEDASDVSPKGDVTSSTRTSLASLAQDKPEDGAPAATPPALPGLDPANTVFPSGKALLLIMPSLYLAMFLIALVCSGPMNTFS